MCLPRRDYSLHDLFKCEGQGLSDTAETDPFDYIHGVHSLFIYQS